MGDEDNTPHDFAREDSPLELRGPPTWRLPQSSAVHFSAVEMVAIVVEDR